MSCPICGFNGFECYDDGTEVCQAKGCGWVKPVKSLFYIDEAEYSVVLGKMYPSNDLKERIRATKILDKQVMIK